MPKPTYVLAFEHFNGNSDPLKAIVAFGLFVESEVKWAQAQDTWPTEAKCKTYHDCQLPHQAEQYQSAADEVLMKFANGLIEQKQAEFLQASIDEFKKEAAKAHHGFWWGVLEGMTAALAWSLLLIITAVIVGRLGIDVLGAFEKATGSQPQHSAPAPPHQ
jgi:hypothetical protein